MLVCNLCRLVMGTRCGDMDPAVLLYLMDKCGLSTREADAILNKKSGFLGICGKADVRAVLEEADAGNERAKLALEVRCSILYNISACFSHNALALFLAL